MHSCTASSCHSPLESHQSSPPNPPTHPLSPNAPPPCTPPPNTPPTQHPPTHTHSTPTPPPTPPPKGARHRLLLQQRQGPRLPGVLKGLQRAQLPEEAGAPGGRDLLLRALRGGEQFLMLLGGWNWGVVSGGGVEGWRGTIGVSELMIAVLVVDLWEAASVTRCRLQPWQSHSTLVQHTAASSTSLHAASPLRTRQPPSPPHPRKRPSRPTPNTTHHTNPQPPHTHQPPTPTHPDV